MINKVYLMDCMEYMVSLPDNAFELAIVDPPYGIGECASRNNTGNRATKKWNNPTSQKYKPFDDSNIPTKEYFDELCRVSKNQIIWGANNFVEHLDKKSCWIVWDKKVGENEHLSMAELAYTSFDTRAKVFRYLWAGFKREGNNAKKEQRIHPTQKPVALYKWLLKNYAKPGDKILDTHIGSGSIRIACHDLGFDLVGCELDPDYWKAQEERFKRHVQQQDLFEADEIQSLVFKEDKNGRLD